ncbi:hypothetical protein COW98_04345 [Candidatus Roizmanbacteria bacterium CG22_combo_CG10-13_8_21_14_all_35_9]|uniref:Uncharacterized protein n=1 Tax=Candidatus Roizmanbacteria bacterium CG22_combo_CG10-13_8_21_14_all_35_9 TaxID=1974861 RepID=A0A2H0BXF8_9BACT|nr:MAG: hypothetical protein COW98_04345 [Candidatus Roizmanbacteria bacterium CG22_combo_CG10-13_8_21_14_all_35_9]
MRLLQFIFFILFSFAWFYVSLVSKPPVLADVPPGVQMVIGILLTGKVLQKGVEAWKENDGKDKNKEDKEKEKEDKDGGK